MKPRACSLIFSIAIMLGQAWAVPMLGAPRVGAYAGYTRAVIDVPDGASWEIEAMGAALRVTFHGVTASDSTVQIRKPELRGWTLEGASSGAVLMLVTPQGVSGRSGFRASRLAPAEGKTGARLVVDLSGAFADTSPLPAVAPFRFIKGANRAFTVVIDPGHGGPDTGAIGFVTEYTLNLDVAKRVAGRLREAGVNVVMTREDSGTISDDKPTDLAARAKLSSGADAFVAIHANSTVASRVNSTYGIEVYYFNPARQKPIFPTPEAEPIAAAPTETLPSVTITDTPPADGTPETPNAASSTTLSTAPWPSDHLEAQADPAALPISAVAGPVPTVTRSGSQTFVGPVVPWTDFSSDDPERASRSKELAMTVLSSLLGSTAGSNGGVRTDTFVVIKESRCPAILVEMGYVKHPVEGVQLRDSNYLDRIAYGIARGVFEALENSPDPR